jgi:hypothetical protein
VRVFGRLPHPGRAGRVHVVERATEQEGVTCLFMRNADEAYFERLFRNMFVDATLFTLLEGAE